MTIARRSALALPALALLPRPAQAAFPDRPVRIIVPFAAGTSSDFQARMIGERMAPVLRQPVIVENRAGAGGVVGADAIALARACASCIGGRARLRSKCSVERLASATGLIAPRQRSGNSRTDHRFFGHLDKQATQRYQGPAARIQTGLQRPV